MKIRGAKFFLVLIRAKKRLRGAKFSMENLRGAKISVENLRGMKNFYHFPKNSPTGYPSITEAFPLTM